MKNDILIILLISFIFGCTKKENSFVPKVSENEVADLTAKISNQTIGSIISATEEDLIENIQSSTFDLDFGQVSPNEAKLKTVLIKNESNSSKTISIQGISLPFQLMLNRCENKSLKPFESCRLTLKMIANPQILNGQINPIEMNIIYGPATEERLTILMKAEMINSVSNLSDWSVEASLSGLGFNSPFTLNQSMGYRYLKIKNKGLTSAPMNQLNPQLHPDYKILINRCQGTLLPSQECSISLFYTKFRERSPLINNSLFIYKRNSADSVIAYNIYSKQEAQVYVPEINIPSNPVTQPCDGSVTLNTSISECRNGLDNSLVDNSLCSNPQPTVSYQSPAGEKLISISNGDERVSCEQGSTASSFIERICDQGYSDVSNQCLLVSYVGQYTMNNPVPDACDGSQSVNESLIPGTCIRQADSQIVNDSFCDSTSNVLYQSPAGTDITTISNGTVEKTCDSGSSTPTLSETICDSLDYAPVGEECVAQSYIGQYESLTNPVPDICDGSSSLIANLLPGSCQTSISNQSVADNLCSATETQSFASPAGQALFPIANGQELRSCEIGSDSGALVSRTCDTDYYNSGSSCSLIPPVSCNDAKTKSRLNLAGNTGSGIYNIDPDGPTTGISSFDVYCDMEATTFKSIWNGATLVASYRTLDSSALSTESFNELPTVSRFMPDNKYQALRLAHPTGSLVFVGETTTGPIAIRTLFSEMSSLNALKNLNSILPADFSVGATEQYRSTIAQGHNTFVQDFAGQNGNYSSFSMLPTNYSLYRGSSNFITNQPYFLWNGTSYSRVSRNPTGQFDWPKTQAHWLRIYIIP